MGFRIDWQLFLLGWRRWMDSAKPNWKNRVLQGLRKHGYVLYLVFWLGVVDLSLIDWRFWTILIPTIILVDWKRKDE